MQGELHVLQSDAHDGGVEEGQKEDAGERGQDPAGTYARPDRPREGRGALLTLIGCHRSKTLSNL